MEGWYFPGGYIRYYLHNVAGTILCKISDEFIKWWAEYVLILNKKSHVYNISGIAKWMNNDKEKEW